MLWKIFEDPQELTQAGPAHYVDAVKAAVLDIEPQLKAIYEKAILKYKDDYEWVLLAVADHHELKRRSSDIYACYRRITDGRVQPLAREKFNQRMNTLKRATHGSILKANRQGWYEFREAIVRGYVRLRAEERGIHLGADHLLGPRLGAPERSGSWIGG